MQLFSVPSNTTVSNQQVQRNIEKLGFFYQGVKAGGSFANQAFAAQAKNVFFTIKRNVAGEGEKTQMIRVSLWQLVCATLGIQGYVSIEGEDAGTTFYARGSFELSKAGNIDLRGGDLTITVENQSTGGVTLIQVSDDWSQPDHLKYQRYSLTANEFKKIPVNHAFKVVIPTAIQEVTLIGLDQVSMDTNGIQHTVREYSSFIINESTGAVLLPDAACLDATFLKELEVSNGNTACEVLVLYQTDYTPKA